MLGLRALVRSIRRCERRPRLAMRRRVSDPDFAAQQRRFAARVWHGLGMGVGKKKLFRPLLARSFD